MIHEKNLLPIIVLFAFSILLDRIILFVSTRILAIDPAVFREFEVTSTGLLRLMGLFL